MSLRLVCLCLTLSVVADCAQTAPPRPRRIVMSSLGMLGHVQTLVPIAHELIARGEDVLWLAPDAYTNEKLLKGIPTYVLRGDVYTRDFERDLCANASHMAEIDDQLGFTKLIFENVMFKNFAAVYRDAKEQVDKFKPDVMFIDCLSNAVGAAGKEAGVPIVLNQPVAPSIVMDEKTPGGLSPRSADELRSPLLRIGRWLENQLIFNFDVVGHYVLGVDELYASVGLTYPGFAGFLDSGIVIHPTYIGYAWPHAVPSNHFFVGPVPLPEDHFDPDSWKQLDQATLDFLNNNASDDGVALVSFGSSGFLPVSRMVEIAKLVRLLNGEGGSTVLRMRVLWRMPVWQQESLAKAGVDVSTMPNLRIVTWLTPSLMAAMAHPRVRVFFTHCGQSSPFEAIAANLPMVGAAALADQMGKAHLLDYAGVGHASSFPITAPTLLETLEQTMEEHEYARLVDNMVRQRYLARSAGGFKRAADIVQETAHIGTRHLRPVNYDWSMVQRLNIDLMAMLCVFTVVATLCVLFCCRCCCSACKSKAQRKSKKD